MDVYYSAISAGVVVYCLCAFWYFFQKNIWVQKNKELKKDCWHQNNESIVFRYMIKGGYCLYKNKLFIATEFEGGYDSIAALTNRADLVENLMHQFKVVDKKEIERIIKKLNIN